ncbi:MAG: CNNM domain-containing protein, partial [Thermoguttaceae bacterium]
MNDYNLFMQHITAIISMIVLMVASAFFSSAEAAYFSLTRSDRKSLAAGGRLAKTANKLAADAERLLSVILLGNQIVNLLYFTLSTIIVFQIQQQGDYTVSVIFAIGTLLAIIVFSEMLPKDLAVLCPRYFAVFYAAPLSLLVRFFRPVLPLFDAVNRSSRRLFFPEFKKEPYLRISDLEQVLEFSKDDAALLRREQKVLQNIVQISDTNVEELMCPRLRLHFFKPPITIQEAAKQIGAELLETGYLFISEKNSDELASAVSLKRVYSSFVNTNASDSKTSDRNKESQKSELSKRRTQTDTTPTAFFSISDVKFEDDSAPVVYVPWTISVAGVLDILMTDEKEVAAVLNEYGETIGVITIDDILETIFGRERSRSRRLLKRASIKNIAENVW